MPSKTESKDTPTPTPKKKKRVETDPTILALRSIQRITQLFRELQSAERSYVMAKLVELDHSLELIPAGPIAGPEDLPAG